MRLIIGLGNPGSKYDETRHNLGFRIVDELAARLGVRLGRAECQATVGEGNDVMLAQPMTYMNRSGFATRCLVERHDLQSEDILVIYDEVWLPLGRLRARPRGSAGGHRGMESILHNLRTDEIPRLRAGVGWEGGPPDGVDLVEYVLDPFDDEERPEVERLVERAADACECWLAEGIEPTMERFNG